jgi:hypothetical protein
MSLPKIPEYITGKFAHEYIAACSEEIQERFEDLQTIRGITIPNNDNVLFSEQVKLFMDAI